MTGPVPVRGRDPRKVAVYRDQRTGHWLVAVYACWVIDYPTWRAAMDHALTPAGSPAVR